MDIATTISRNNVVIRLTDERWKHIILMHPNLADKQKQVLNTVKDPDLIFQGAARELLATIELSKVRYLVVVYKELITDTYWLFKKEIIWSKHS